MFSEVQNQYSPDYISPPGDTLLEALEERDMSQAELSRRMGRPKKTINEIIKGKAAITPETALQLERVLQIPSSFWNNRQKIYDQYLVRKNEEQRLLGWTDWLNKFPIAAMIEFGWIKPFDNDVQQIDELLRYFGIATPKQWEALVAKQTSVAFRKTKAFQSDLQAISSWLRQGEIEAQQIQCKEYKSQAFLGLLNDEIRSLTIQPPEVFCSKLVQLCSEVGVAVTFIPQLPGAKVSGATRWLNPNKALIQLSLRYKKDDQLWFSFFHEAGHIQLHGKRDIFLEREGDEIQGKKEEEANKFAADVLIPPAKLKEFVQNWKPGLYLSKRDIRAFAAEIGITPGIVVGRLQHDKYVPFSHYNDLKRTFVWSNS